MRPHHPRARRSLRVAAPRAASRLGALVLSTVLLAAGAAVPTTGSASAAPADPPGAGPGAVVQPEAAAEPLLPGPRHGEAAVRRLGELLPRAAARNDLAPAALRGLLTTDPTAWLDEDGRLYYVEPADPTPTAYADTGAAAPAPLDQTFRLHSSPGAERVIFLDVDGATVSDTAWSSSGIAATHPAWDPAGDGAGFSDAEKASVQQVWSIVAEDFAPWDVDVTTEDPGTAGLVRSSPADTDYGTRALISPSDDAWLKICQRSCGGVAYVGVFDTVRLALLSRPGSSRRAPAALPRASPRPPRTRWATTSVSPTTARRPGTTTAATASGRRSWGWATASPSPSGARGHYTGANNHEDDLATIGDYLDTRPDEAGNLPSAPGPLPSGTAYVTAPGDVDTYLLGTCTAGAHVSVEVAALSGDLDVRATVRAGDGSAVATADPASGVGDGRTASGLGAVATVPDAGSGYTVAVDGVGRGTWAANGYDDYGSLGAYTVTADGCDGAPVGVAPGLPTGVTATAGASSPRSP